MEEQHRGKAIDCVMLRRDEGMVLCFVLWMGISQDLYRSSNRADQSLFLHNQAKLHLQVPFLTAHKTMVSITMPEFVALTIKAICLGREIAI